MKFNYLKFKKDISKKRVPRLHSQYKSVRAAAEEAGIHFSTFSRIERFQPPDIETFARICNWMKVHPKKYFKR